MFKSAQIYLAESYVNRTQFFFLEGLVAACELWSPQHLCVLWRSLRTWLTSVEGGSGSSWPSRSPPRAQLSCHLSLGCASCVAGEGCLWLRKSRLWAVFQLWDLLGEAAAFQVASVWPSGKVMQFEACINIKALQVGRKSMGKRRDAPVDVISSPGGSKASNEWCQCMSPGWGPCVCECCAGSLEGQSLLWCQWPTELLTVIHSLVENHFCWKWCFPLFANIHIVSNCWIPRGNI